MEDNLLTLAPIEEYQKPNLPTYHETKPDLRKKIPSRWKNKAMIAATSLTLLSTIPLSGCILHHGGAGGAPMYVVQLTEQEAIGIIRAQLEEVGLNFDEPKKPYHVRIDWDTAEIILVHEEKDIRIALVDRWWGWGNEEREMERRIEFTNSAIKQFEYEFDITVDRIIFSLQDEVWTRDDEPGRKEEIEEDIIQQVHNFIEQLREEGIVE